MTQQNASILTPQQERAAALLASGKRIGATAKAVGVHRVTLWEWTRLPEFQRHLNDLRRAAWRSARDRMRENATRAAQVLGSILTDPKARAQDRIAAARVVLTSAGPLFSEPGVPDDVESRGVPVVEQPRSWSDLAMWTARRALELSGQPYMLASAPGAAWVEAQLTRIFPDSFDQLRALAGKPDEAAEFCRDLLKQFQDLLDRRALQDDDRDDDGDDEDD